MAMNAARGRLREAGPGRGSARSGLRGRLLWSARVAGRGQGRQASALGDRRRRCAAGRGAQARQGGRGWPGRRGRRRRARSRCGTSTSSGSSRRCARGSRMLSGKKLTFDEESRQLYDAVAPSFPETYFEGTLRRAGGTPAGQGPLIDRYDAWRKDFVIAPAALEAVFDRGDRRVPARTLQHVELPPERELHRRVRHEQVVERLQLVSGQLQEPDPGQHGPSDLHRPRGRSRLPRRLPRPSRLQRAAREAAGPRPGLGRKLRVRAVLAAVAHRRRHRQLRHRGDVLAARTGSPSSATCCFRPRA